MSLSRLSFPGRSYRGDLPSRVPSVPRSSLVCHCGVMEPGLRLPWVFFGAGRPLSSQELSAETRPDAVRWKLNLLSGAHNGLIAAVGANTRLPGFARGRRSPEPAPDPLPPEPRPGWRGAACDTPATGSSSAAEPQCLCSRAPHEVGHWALACSAVAAAGHTRRSLGAPRQPPVQQRALGFFPRHRLNPLLVVSAVEPSRAPVCGGKPGHTVASGQTPSGCLSRRCGPATGRYTRARGYLPSDPREQPAHGAPHLPPREACVPDDAPSLGARGQGSPTGHRPDPSQKDGP